MRILTLLLLLSFLSCKNTPKEKPTQQKTEPIEWVEYKAKNNPKGKHILLISGDEEYRSEEALPQLAKILTKHHGFDCTVLFAQNPEKPGFIDPNFNSNIPGLEKLKDADLMILFTRFRNLPREQMVHFENYLKNGKPLLAIRTATHAFNFSDKGHPFKYYGWDYKGNETEWHLGFGKAILGETWYTHHGHHKHQSTRGIIAPNAENHPIVNGIEDGSIWGPTDVYGIRMPMNGDAKSIVLGQSIDRTDEFNELDPFYGMKESDQKIATITKEGNNGTPYDPNENMPPIVWSKSYQIPEGKTGQTVTSTIGSSTDLIDEEVRRLMVNASFYLLKMKVPTKAEVSIISEYKPSAYAFQKDEYWVKKGLKVEDFSWE